MMSNGRSIQSNRTYRISSCRSGNLLLRTEFLRLTKGFFVDVNLLNDLDDGDVVVRVVEECVCVALEDDAPERVCCCNVSGWLHSILTGRRLSFECVVRIDDSGDSIPRCRDDERDAVVVSGVVDMRGRVPCVGKLG